MELPKNYELQPHRIHTILEQRWAIQHSGGCAKLLNITTNKVTVAAQLKPILQTRATGI
jgi:hypothetical protein